MKTTLKQYATVKGINILDAWQELVCKGVFKKPVYTRFRESDGVVVLDYDYIKKIVGANHSRSEVKKIAEQTLRAHILNLEDEEIEV